MKKRGIKSLEDVASGKISAETYFLKEKEKYLQEIEVLRSQLVDKKDVTELAMENQRLNEEIRTYVYVITVKILALQADSLAGSFTLFAKCLATVLLSSTNQTTITY